MSSVSESAYDLHLGELRLSSFTQLNPKAMSQKSGGEVAQPLSVTRTSGTILALPKFTPSVAKGFKQLQLEGTRAVWRCVS